MEKIKEYKNLFFLILAVLIFFFLYNNTSKRFDRLEGQHDILQGQYEAKKDGVEVKYQKYILKLDSITKLVSIKDTENQRLKDDNKKLQEKIDGINSRPIITPKDLQGLVNYYNTAYKTKENRVIENKVGLGLTTAMEVSNDLEEGFRVSEILPLKNQQIKNLDSIVTNLNSSKEALTYSLELSGDQIKEYRQLQELASANLKNLEKQNKVLKTKNTLNKILIPVSVATGVFIGTKIK